MAEYDLDDIKKLGMVLIGIFLGTVGTHIIQKAQGLPELQAHVDLHYCRTCKQYHTTGGCNAEAN